LNEKLIKSVSSKPLVAVWFRECQEDLELNAPLKIFTLMSEAKPVLEADGLLLLNPSRNIVESFVPSRYGLFLQGKTVMVSVNGVSVLT